ncbi:hypothetical protein [Vibrio sagamiensis]|uniref:Uncharacterized protein n=1 Tax=Vibrio sagamiensis NBRC 104589 TaxID=1219064 RepID=A0A511QHI4_9VIBR|nr:hypothetical protein [Vibrio sagamiensis]GEM76763.1 hypothetical protein VSA01S_28750 [Vibrio sagamiensis NBRC 104589]
MLKKILFTTSIPTIAFLIFHYGMQEKGFNLSVLGDDLLNEKNIQSSITSTLPLTKGTPVQTINSYHIDDLDPDEQSYDWAFNTWRQPSEKFDHFISLSSKVLTTTSDRQNFELLLNDYKMVEASRIALLSDIDTNRYNYDDERERWDAIYYISSIITGKYRTQYFNDIINLSIEIINKPLPENITDIEIKKSLIGDKVEIAMDLAIFQPEVWLEYKTNSTPSMDKFIHYVDTEASFSRAQAKDNAERLATRLKNLSEKTHNESQ